MSRHEDRLDFDDYDDTPGKSWDDFDGRLKNYAAGKTDDRGWSLADHFGKVDEGCRGRKRSHSTLTSVSARILIASRVRRCSAVRAGRAVSIGAALQIAGSVRWLGSGEPLGNVPYHARSDPL